MNEFEKKALIIDPGKITEEIAALKEVAGGRVLNVVGVAKDIPEAVKKAYAGVEKISFDGAHYRKDIAHRALERLK